MRRAASALTWLLLLLSVAGRAHAAGAPVVRVTIEGKQPVLVGQSVKVNVQVLVPNFFMSAPDWPALDIPGAVVTQSEGSAINLNDTIGGQSYAGIQLTYLITPQRAGNLTLPPARITFQYAAEPGKPTAGAVTLPPRTIVAALPAGVAASGGAAAPVAKVTLGQTLDRRAEGLEVGDALTRTVTAYAESTRAMMIPPPRLEAPRGVRVYPQDPVLTDVTRDRGGFAGGRRVDRVTYVFEEPGDYTLPAVEIEWLNPTTGRPEVARAPEIRVSVAPNPGFTPEIAPESPAAAAPTPARRPIEWRYWLGGGAGILVAALVLAWLTRRYGPRYRAWSAARRLARAESEAAYFARVERACAASDGLGAYRALGAWVRRAGAPSVAAWCAEHGSAELRRDVETLERALFGGRGPAGEWDGRALARSGAAAREAWLARNRAAAAAAPALPALN
jgi:hypothetical protein